MSSGCLGLLTSWAFLGLIVAVSLLYIYFGPRNPLIGIGAGAGMAAGCYWLFRRFPFLLGAAGGSSRLSKLLARGTAEATNFAKDSAGSRNTVVGTAMWILIGIAGIATLYFGKSVVTLTLDQQYSSDLSAAALACGAAGYMTYAVWTLKKKIG